MNEPAPAATVSPPANEKTPALHPAAWWLAFALAALPLLQWLPIDFDRSAALAVLPAVWAGRRWVFGSAAAPLRIGRRTLALWIAAAAGLAISLLTAHQPAPALVEAASWGLLLCAGLVARGLARERPQEVPALFAGLLIGALLGIGIVLTHWLSLPDPHHHEWVELPLYAQVRLFGFHMMSATAAALVLVETAEKRPVARAALLLAGTVACAALCWSGGRAPEIGLVLFAAAWIWPAAGKRRRRLAETAVTFVAGAALSLQFWTTDPSLGLWRFVMRFDTAKNLNRFSSGRIDQWRSCLHHFLASPLTGAGPDGYRFLMPKLPGQQPHNFVLQALLNLGPLGGTAALLLLAGALWLAVKTARARPAASRAARAGGALVLAYAGLGLFDGAFYHLLAFLPFALAAGLLAGGAAQSASATRCVAPAALRAVAVVCAALLCFHTWLFLRLNTGPAPRSPAAATARALRAFPSATYGLWHWLDAWKTAQPAAALAWSRWATGHSPEPWVFREYSARLLLAAGDPRAAAGELDAASREAPPWTAPVYRDAARQVRALTRPAPADTK